MNKVLNRGGLWLSALWLSACASAPPQQTATTSPIAQATDAPTFVLMGELHDNPEHHRVRGEQLRRMIRETPGTVVVFEQIGRAQDDAVAEARRVAPADMDATLAAGQFDRKNWRWPLHQPLFDAVLAGGAELRGGNLEREQVRRIVREGDAAWPADLLALRQRTRWEPAQQAALVQDIQEGHCNAMPAAMLPGMVQAQRARDAAMAQAMLDARARGATRVVLIAGNGHVRRDVAVPVYLQAAGVAASDIRAIAYLEPASTPGAGEYDAVERAPAPERGDPCAAFKR